MFTSRILLPLSLVRHKCFPAKHFGKRFFTHCTRISKPIDLSLYLVTNRSCVCDEKIFISKVLEGVRGGVTCVQIRDKEEDRKALVRTATKLKSLLTPLNIPLIVNDHVDVALAVGADGVHLGQRDMPSAEARRILGQQAIIGLSVDTWEDVINAKDLDVDYLGISQLFRSKVTKTDCLHSWGLDGLKRARLFTHHRLVPIGGITLTNLPDVCKELNISKNGDGIAMVGELWRADNPRMVAQKIRTIMEHISIESRGSHV